MHAYGHLQLNLFWVRVYEHSIDPLGRRTVTAGSDHYFHTWCLSVRPSVRPSVPNFQDLANKFLVKLMIAASGTVGLTQRITDGTHVSS